MLEKIKSAIQPFSVNPDVTLSALDEKEFLLKSQFNSDFDLTNPKFLKKDPQLFGMIEEHDKYITNIIQSINGGIRLAAMDSNKINEWMWAMDAVSQQRIKIKAYFFKITQDLHDNVFKKQKDIVKFMRNNGFDFDPLEIQTFFDGDGFPAAYGMVIKNDQSDQVQDVERD